jgi:hypothetical protein
VICDALMSLGIETRLGAMVSTIDASAVTGRCVALTAKAYPPRVPGNPAAGLAKGTAQSARDYFNKCVANRGNMDDHVPKQAE